MKSYGCTVCILVILSASTTSANFGLLGSTNFTENVLYKLYTSSNPIEPQLLKLNDKNSILNSNFNKELQTKFLIHGWISNYDERPTVPVRDAYLSRGDFNFISVDWTYFSRTNYVTAVQIVPKIGEEVAKFIDYLNENFELNFDELVIIGHSLGAHVSGFAGKNVKRGRIAGIVGLDAANPLYNYNEDNTHLQITDAKYVVTIHVTTVWGTIRPIGHVSYYPNWGRKLPGCNVLENFDLFCSHDKAPALYAAAISGNALGPYYKCDSLQNILYKNGCNESVDNARIGDPLEVTRVEGLYYLEVKEGDI